MPKPAQTEPPDPERARLFREAREELGLDYVTWAIVLGYQSESPAAYDRMRTQIERMENALRPITAQVARLAEMLRRFGVPDDFRD